MRLVCFRWILIFGLGPLLGFGQATVPTVLEPLPGQTLGVGGSGTVDLRAYFGLPGVTGQIVQFNTVSGRYNFEMYGVDAPLSVANFLNYVNRGAYNNTIIHRSVPGFVVQGGGYTYSVNSTHIPVDAPVRNEFRRPNVRGTVAMAKLGGNPDSATSEWFVNLADNRANLDNQNGGFTVFARVLGTGMTVIDAVAALPVANVMNLEGVPVRNVTAGQTQLLLQNLVAVTSVAQVAIYPSAGGGTAVLSFSLTNSEPDVVSAVISGSTLTLTPIAAGTANISVRATDTHGNSAVNSFVVGVQGVSSVGFSQQPVSQTVAPGGGAELSVVALGNGPLSYQWMRNGVNVAGATQRTLSFVNVAATAAGDYTVSVSDATGRATSWVARLTVAEPELGRLVNLSVRSLAGVNGEPLIVGFNVGGGAKTLLVRGIGPGLGAFGVPDTLVDPLLKIFAEGPSPVEENDDWGASANGANLPGLFARLGAFALPAGSRDAALAVTIGGSRTAHVMGKTATAGVALVELYDAGSGNAPRLTNVSARNFVGTGDNVLIAGFVISGNVPRQLLVRAVGPTLADFGVVGTLLDPRLEISSGDTLVASGDNWSDEPNAAVIRATAARVGAFALKEGSRDAALVLTLPAGAYSAKISGVRSATGVALVEIYEVSGP
jgi:cyclophilin family peptidyl-prolyl cis-trans isomerase